MNEKGNYLNNFEQMSLDDSVRQEVKEEISKVIS